MTADNPQRVFIRSDNTAKVRCPSCGLIKTVRLPDEAVRRADLKVRCSCSAVFQIHLEHRKFYRKTTNLDGIYFVLSADSGMNPHEQTGRINCRVENISITGVGFSTFSRHLIEKETRIFLAFTLDNQEKTRIEKTGVAQFIKGNYIGMAFDNSANENKALGFYLMP